MTEKTRRLLPTISLIIAMLLWASSFVAMKLAFRGYHPMQVVFARMVIASLLFLVFIPSFMKIKWRFKDLKYLSIMAACEPCLYFLLEAEALKRTSASQAGMITAMLPLLVAILAWFWLGEHIGRQTLIGFSLAIIGACWLSLASDASNNAPNPLLGNFFEFLAMVCAAVYTVSLKHLTHSYPPLFFNRLPGLYRKPVFFPFSVDAGSWHDHNLGDQLRTGGSLPWNLHHPWCLWLLQFQCQSGSSQPGRWLCQFDTGLWSLSWHGYPG